MYVLVLLNIIYDEPLQSFSFLQVISIKNNDGNTVYSWGG